MRHQKVCMLQLFFCLCNPPRNPESGLGVLFLAVKHCGMHCPDNKREAPISEKAEEHEKAAHHAYLAHGYTQHAIDCYAEAAKLLSPILGGLALAGGSSWWLWA